MIDWEAYLACHVDQALPRHLLLLVQEHLQRRHRALEVGVVELVLDVPALFPYNR